MSKKPCDSLINHPLSRDQASPPRNGFGGHVQYPCRGRLSAPISTQSNSVPPQAAHIHSTPAIIRPGGHRWHSPPPNSWQSHNQERGPRGSLFLEVIIFDRSAGRRPFLLFPKVPAKSPGVKLATSGCHRRPAPPTANSVSRDSRGPLSGKAATPLIHPFRPPPPSSFISHFPKYMTMVKQPSSNPRKSRHLPKIQILPPLVAEIPRTPCLISSDAIDRGSRYLYMISY